MQETVLELGPNLLLVAHSLACLMVAHWVEAGGEAGNVAGALLVAPPNPQLPAFPASAEGFALVPRIQLPFPSILVSSTDDPYSDAVFVEGLAKAWGSKQVSVGDKGHINAQSGLADWPEGLRLLRLLSGQKEGLPS